MVLGFTMLLPPKSWMRKEPWSGTWPPYSSAERPRDITSLPLKFMPTSYHKDVSPIRLAYLAIVLATVSGCSPTGAPRRGYSIPLVDISGDLHRQVIVDREEGQYLGHPTTVLLEDSTTLLAVYPKGHGRGAIVMKRSLDAGLTWSDRLEVPASWSTSMEVPTIYRTVDPAGNKRLILFSGLHPIRRALSDDDGHTWTELEPIGTFGGIVAMASMARLSNGNYMAFFHDDGRFIGPSPNQMDPPVFTVYQTISPDGGLIWGAPKEILSRSDVHLCEPGLVRSPDGSRMALLLRENSRTRNSYIIFSDDEGDTWTDPRELPGALTGDRHTARYLPDGRLFISFRDTALETLTAGDWLGWVGSYKDLEAGNEGQYRVRLMDNKHGWDSTYPAVEVLPDGTVVTTTYGHWQEDQEPYIVSIRFRVEELDEQYAMLIRP